MSALMITAAVLAVLVLFFRLLVHLISRNPRIPNSIVPSKLGLDYEDLRIPTENGRFLHAWYLKQDHDAPAIVIIQHGWGRNAMRMMDLINELHQEGYDVLAADARNHGESDSDFYSSVKMFKEDILKVAQFARSNLRRNADQKLFLFGHSIGGSASILAAAEDSTVNAVITCGAFADPETIITGSLRRFHIPYYPVIYLMLKYIQYRLKTSFDPIRPVNRIPEIKGRVLLLHGKMDTVVPPSEFERLRKACVHCQAVLFDDANHSNVRNEPGFYPLIKAFYRQSV